MTGPDRQRHLAVWQDNPPCEGALARRTLVSGALWASVAALCGGACGGDDESAPATPFPAVVDGKVTLPMSAFPALAKAGGAVAGRPEGGAWPRLIVARAETGAFVTVDGTCTHMKCSLRFNSLNQTLDCGCHGSTFELDGAVINGPAVVPIKVYPTTFDGTNIVVAVGA